MNDPNPADRAARLADRQAVLYITKANPDLPEPFCGPDRANFFFINIKDPRQAREAVAAAQRIFAAELGAVFACRSAQHSNGLRYMYEAALGGGLVLALVVRAEHMDGADAREDAAELTGSAA
jgi:hypothetical protein